MNELVDEISKFYDVKWKYLRDEYPKKHKTILVSYQSKSKSGHRWLSLFEWNKEKLDYFELTTNPHRSLAWWLGGVTAIIIWIPLYQFEYQLNDATISNQLVLEMSSILNKYIFWRPHANISKHNYILVMPSDIGVCFMFEMIDDEYCEFFHGIKLNRFVKENTGWNKYLWMPWKYPITKL